MNKYILSNGIRLVYEKLNHLRSLNIGVWVKVGSANEDSTENGLSHFIEHLVFKGTESRTAKSIAEEVDRMGAQINAFTGKECTCYYIRALDQYLDKSLDILSDIVFNPSFSENDINTERGVILEEISMCNDNPEEVVNNLSYLNTYDGSLSMPIIGNSEKISNYSREDIIKYWSKHYTPENIVVSVVGNFDEDKLVGAVESYFENCKNKNVILAHKDNKLSLKSSTIDKDIEQLHIMLSYKGFETNNDMEYALAILSNILGGGMSSKLVQRIREDLGLVYNIYSYTSKYKDAGTLNIYAATNAESSIKVINEIKTIFKNLPSSITEDELNSSKAQLSASIEFSLESTSARMSMIGRSTLILDSVKDIDEIYEKINNVTLSDIKNVWKYCVSECPSISIVGPNSKKILENINEE